MMSDRSRSSGPEYLNLSEETAGVVRRVFSCQSFGRKPSSRSVVTKSAGVQPLFFGDFLLGQQKKVTRLSGRDPTRCTASATRVAEAKQRPIAKPIP